MAKNGNPPQGIGSPTGLEQRLRESARALGFSMLGIVPARPSPHLDAYHRWIGTGMHGEMAYMARPDRVARRADLNLIVSGAKSIIVTGVDYSNRALSSSVARDPTRGRISNYAWGADYHAVMLPKLEALAAFLAREAGVKTRTRAYVDTGAILERSHAQETGLGFIGKNTLLIHPRRGSYLFLGEIITDLELSYDSPVTLPTCGSCTRCLAACPTQAFPTPYVLDARRCISYLTIEHKGFIPRELRPLMGNWVYGCDVCQEVCPWQRFAKPGGDSPSAAPDPDRAAPPLCDLLALDGKGFEQRFQGTAVYRIKRDRMVRNACIAAGNSSHPELRAYLSALLTDRSELVRGHAAWALGRLGGSTHDLTALLTHESSESVRSEIVAALKDDTDA
jgi:epoxyqueuosine reductase